MEEGDIIHVDYDLYNGETGDLIETTREATAQEHEMHDENRTYQPMVCVVGSGSLIPGFEEALLEAKVDKDVDLELAPADAYGEKIQPNRNHQHRQTTSVRDPECTLSRRSCQHRRSPRLPLVPRAGRARIDYNHPMAGKTLKYNFKIVKVVEGKEEKVAALLESNTGHSDFGVTFDGDDLSIVIPQTMLFDTNAAMMKFRLVTVLRDAVDCGKVSFIEEHEPRVIAEEE